MAIDFKPFLASTDQIDWHEERVISRAKLLANGTQSEQHIIENCFNFVRDEIIHSGDFQCNPITSKASDVLFYGTGYCYAKSHLLAALLRANNIPAGLCYQRLHITDENSGYCLHGLNAVYLQDTGWLRVDARGNKVGVSASFTPPIEDLAYQVRHEGEADLPEIWHSPLADVVEALNTNDSVEQFINNLPDVLLRQ